MSGQETIAKQLRLPLIGLAFVLLFAFQVKGAVHFFSAPLGAGYVYHQEDEQQQNLWQVEENSSRDGLVSDWQLSLAAALVVCLLLSFFPDDDVAKPLTAYPPLLSRNFCCIVPKGP
ncbi:hypothetical protein CLV24_12377 [Pontibacter ummariensis]|uniref:Uncharacterized protein n=1 Tax=Pontibacter ummariensis TaxID=1610492 RepID=A0A239JU13_9BACT|nr:hypothetical protein [Pontibacter ummariensis]PRY07428.1 hypothetical protein CLV24_12377 [Pontibacter ummariensis]SNT09199.1 hypothetical protein SAMN06296052_12377 [Pontibacter ummariensis]